MSMPSMHCTPCRPTARPSLSPEGSSMELDPISLEPLDPSTRIESFPWSESCGRGASPDGSGSSASDLEAFIFQEYSMPALMAYGQPPLAPPIDQAFMGLNVMLPYPLTTAPPWVMDPSGGSSGPPTVPVTAYCHSQAIRDWSGACSSGLPLPNAPPLICPSASQDHTSHVIAESKQGRHHASQPPTGSSNESGSVKNKLNLRVDTTMGPGFAHQDPLAANDYCIPLTPCPDSANSSSSPSALSFYGESNYSSSNHPDHHNTTLLASLPVPSPLDVVDWLASNNQYQHLTSHGGPYHEPLPTPPSAAFSTVPTPTTCSTNSWAGFDHASLPPDMLPVIPNTHTPSPPTFHLATNFASLPSPSSKNLSSGQLPMAFHFSDSFDLHSRGEWQHPSGQNLPTIYGVSSIFGHVASLCNQEPSVGLGGPGLHPSNRRPPPHVSPVLLSTSLPTDPNPPKNGRKTSSSRPKGPVGAEAPCTHRRPAGSADVQKENKDPLRPRAATPPTSGSLLLKTRTLVGSRLKPGPKARSALVQHPPPTRNLIGLNPSDETSGIPKEILKCLYETIVVESDATGRPEHPTAPSNRRYVCKLDGCGRSFPRKTAIESHLQTHLEDKPFLCHHKNCNAAFVRQHDLRRHQQIHSETKAFSCTCGKGFARGDALMRHRQRGICMGGLGPVRRS